MSLLIATVMFFVLVIGVALLPFVPAIAEWRRRKDAEPLKVVRRSEVDVRHFARSFRQFVTARLQPELEKCRSTQTTLRGTLEDGTPYLIVGDGRSPVLSKDEQSRESEAPLVLSCGDVRLPDETMFYREIYAEGAVRSGENNVVRAILSHDEILLDRDSVSLRWLHAARAVYARAGAVLWGRASADELIRIERGCRFERLYSPRIEFSHAPEAGDVAGGAVYRENAVLKPGDFSNRIEVAAGRWLVFGDIEIPPGKIVDIDVVATGRLRLGAGVRVTGSLKSRREMRLDKGVEVDGSVVSEQNIYIGPECRIGGPVLSEGTTFVRTGTRIGSEVGQTTVGAERLYIEPGVETHGTVWAHIEGVVASPDDDPKEESHDEVTSAS